MEKTYQYDQGSVRVIFPEECDRENLKKITIDFIKDTIKWRETHGNCNTCKNFEKE